MDIIKKKKKALGERKRGELFLNNYIRNYFAFTAENLELLPLSEIRFLKNGEHTHILPKNSRTASYNAVM